MTGIAPRTMLVATAGAIVVAAGAIVVVLGRGPVGRDAAPCGAGFARAGARCLPAAASACPAPLVATERGCDAAERDVVPVPATTVIVGPSDWEAEGRVAPRTAVVHAFALDRLEVTVGRACASPVFAGARLCAAAAARPAADAARAASAVTRSRARAYCAARGGRLPTEDEWLAAAGGERPRRYPWGDTGAVCRRAAWGLSAGPCAEGADGPDTVGAHPDGATPLGIHDLAGNVAEWVEAEVEADASAPADLSPDGGGEAVVRGGSWQTRLAADLRTWARQKVPPGVEDRGIGFRCAYDQVP